MVTQSHVFYLQFFSQALVAAGMFGFLSGYTLAEKHETLVENHQALLKSHQALFNTVKDLEEQMSQCCTVNAGTHYAVTKPFGV